MLKKSIAFIIFTFVISQLIVAQQQKGELKDDLTRLQNGEDLNVLYRNESTFGFYAHSAGGFGIAYRRGKHVTGKRKRMFEIEAQNFKHPKEVKTVNSYYENTKSFYYGKLNSFFIIRPGFGYQNVLYQKGDKKSVEIRAHAFAGLDITFAKPVYLEIIRPTSDPLRPVISTERYNPDEHFTNNIYGKAPFYVGMSKTTIHPGVYGKFALSFEYADRYNSIKAIETGVIVDAYPWVLPMMAFNKNQQVFVELYLKFMFGKKWF